MIAQTLAAASSSLRRMPLMRCAAHLQKAAASVRTLQTLRIARTNPLSTPLFASASRLQLSLHPHMQRRFAVVDFRPKLSKTRKAFKGIFKEHTGGSLRNTVVFKGDFGLRAVEPGRIKDKQLNAINIMVRRILRKEKNAKIVFRVATHRPVSSKPAEVRMGKGKGAVDYYAAWISVNRILFEIVGARKELALKALQVAAEALPIKTKIVERDPALKTNPKVMPFFIAKKLRQLEYEAAGSKSTVESTAAESKSA